jgi:signal transduction histidine kinase/ActR/RegA family two-component response regulator
LILSGVVFVASDRLSVQGMVAQRMRTLAEMFARSSATALSTGDPVLATRILAGLSSDTHILSARILTGAGEPFAEYVREGESPESAVRGRDLMRGEPEHFYASELVVTQPIALVGQPKGLLVLRSDLKERDERIRAQATLVAVVSLIALGAALVFGRLAQRSISEPILELVQAAHRIAAHNDFSMRPRPRGSDEIGALVLAFNHMLDGLQLRDEELRSTHQELERRITDADQANRMKDEFLATLSHELRTPLNAILGWSHILRRGGLDPEAVDRALETISRNALAQGQIVADILDMQRIADGKLRLNLQSVDLGPLVRRALDTISPAARARDIEMQAVMGEDVPPVLGDEGRLQQVMWNLLSNAVKFTPKGGRVRVELRLVDSLVEVTVGDTGPGLDPAFIPFVFDRFRQADSSSTRRHGGLGIGLAIVRNLVELHGGTVSAANREDGGGAVFVVRLPGPSVPSSGGADASEEPRSEADRSVSLHAAPSLQGVRVLVVDDDMDSREIIAATLVRCGAEVATANSAEEGMAALILRPPHVLLSDIEMPDEDGYSFMRRIRQLPAEKGGRTLAAAVTAYAGAEDRMRALAAGFQMHVAKPVQPAELAAVVASLARGPLRQA